MLPLSYPKNSTKIEPTETYHIPNQQIFYKDFDGLFRFEIASFFEGENLIFVRPLFMLNALCPNECKKSGLH